ncbi:tripartite tricarboxylate transporter substrate-binding protein [Falsiroseomonas oryzae]|uniref:tripartite tricarboxylate transporter substrate-binding protein n=1 Tax=Falsiroseomonas oryzae TaxID=2766473 RepID=UPI0022EB1ED4|nr:tripartite tricarboxylate transporter substrate-binding protein [Roseomonas sp. MO-31]
MLGRPPIDPRVFLPEDALHPFPARILLGLALGLGLAAGAAAQTFPTRPITMIVGFAPGGPSDVIARLVAPGMSAELGQPVVIENVPGAGGTIGQRRFIESRPDGHTLFKGSIGQATVPTLYRRLAFDPLAMEAVGLVNEVPMTVVVRRGFPAATLAEFVAIARRENTRLNLGTAGVGSTSHLCGLLLMSALGAPLTEVPYRGSALVLNDLVAGNVDIGCDQSTNTAEQIRAGTIRALGVSTPARVEALPGVPTTEEGGLAEMRMSGWNMLFAPGGTPRPVVERLNRALLAAMRDETVIRRMTELGAPPVTGERTTPEAARAHWMGEIARWRPLIQGAGQFAD